MKRLRVPPLDKKTKDYPRGVVFRVGLFTGMCIISVAGKTINILTNSLETPLNPYIYSFSFNTIIKLLCAIGRFE